MSAFPAAATYTLTQRFYFDAAHTLRREIIAAADKAASRRVHGHTYYCEISVTGAKNPATGMVTDLGKIRLAIDRVREQLDHHFLDEIPELGIPTLENLCAFIYAKLSPQIVGISAVRVWRESVGDGCTLTA
jgi:6-pyruvoyltetrahydropterin/6-carboxytetrahydropterin synthase